MLDTVLEIGKTFRKENRLEHHRYLKKGYFADNKIDISYLNIPVNDKGIINLKNISKIDNEYLQEKLYYLNFKTSDADSLKKYLFGDIYRTIKKDSEDGNYRFGDPNVKAKAFSINSFLRAEEDAKYFANTKIESFRNSFRNNIDKIEKLIKENDNIYLHFDFQGKHWYQLEEDFKQINEKIFESFVSFNETLQGYVLDKFLYKTLANGRSISPGNKIENSYKNKYFKTVDEIMDILYAIDYSTKALITKGNIKIIALPRSKNLSAKLIEDFFSKRKLSEHLRSIGKINAENTNIDELFSPMVENDLDLDTQYDIILSKSSGSPSAPDIDLIEVSRIQKSFLIQLYDQVIKIKKDLLTLVDDEESVFSTQVNKLNIFNSFRNILGDVTKDKKKYQSHLLKVLPKIYTGTYYRDDVLLPAFIHKVEHNIRQGKSDYNFLKYDYYFLIKLRNKGENTVEEMKNNPNYKMGFLLGKMAKPLGYGSKPKIASFEKAYVGLLSRRIMDLKQLRKFSNFINEKLNIHKVAYNSLKNAYLDLIKIIDSIDIQKYDRELCAFGFFEGYYTFHKDVDEHLEKNEGENNE